MMDPFQTRAVTIACAMLANLSFGGAFAQSSEAARYVNRQGIEIIASRGSASSGLGERMPERRASKLADPKKMPRPAALSAAIPDRLFVSARQQAARDQDRLAILQEELKAETTAFESKRRLLHEATTSAKLGPEERRLSEEAMRRHQSNIRALNAEIGRVRI